MNIAKNNILQHKNGNSFAFQILRSKKIANVDQYTDNKLTHEYKDITIEHANKLWATAIKTGYEVAF
jgi:competence protein ComGF|tara:strand:+ start:1237 stop:1437 length:201 start_codon:yes stop_codon:yes gene_type:complete